MNSKATFLFAAAIGWAATSPVAAQNSIRGTSVTSTVDYFPYEKGISYLSYFNETLTQELMPIISLPYLNKFPVV